MKIAVFYHCKISGEGIPDAEASSDIVFEQMSALKESGLAAASGEIHIGINGGEDDALLVALFAPEKAELHIHGKESRAEHPTFAVMQRWLPSHSDWFVLYHHSKGVTSPGDTFHHYHRRTMEAALVWNWQTCVKDLERGYEAVGINWVDPKTRPVIPGRFYAGNFWWARAEYLLQLPPLPERVEYYNLYERQKAEGWIGSCHRRPITLDYERPHLSDWCQYALKQKT